MKQLCIFILFAFLLTDVSAQNQIGTPQIINYSNLAYRAGTQNWDSGQDAQGIMYFGNNEGLLTFNGKFWKLYPLPNKTVVRSLEIDPNGRIYVGGQDEIGYFFPDGSGKLLYHSLKGQIAENERQFADIWNISIVKGQVFFRALSKILHLKDGVLKIIKPEQEWVFLGKAKDRLYAQERKKGLFTYTNGVWKPICQDPILQTISISSILHYSDDTYLVTTLKHGLFLLKNSTLVRKTTSEDLTLFNDRIYCAVSVNKDWYALGTTSAGVLIIDKNGNLVQKYSFPEGLQKNNIRSVFIDQNKNLWLGLDDGIDFMAINSAIKQIYPDNNKQVTSYAIRIFNKRLYIGTSNGLFHSSVLSPVKDDISLSPGYFSEVKKTKGQVWGLEEINNNLLLAHEDGTFVIKDNSAQQIFSNPGTWLFNAVSDFFPSKSIIAGTYTGLQHITYNDGTFVNSGPIQGVNDPLRFMYYDASSNSVWASHPYHGIYKIKLAAGNQRITQTRLFTRKDGLPSTLYNYLFRIKNRILVATEKGIYEYNAENNNFIRSPQYYEPLQDIPIQYLKEDPSGNIWFITANKEVGIIDFNQPKGERSYSVVYFPELSSKVVGGFETIYPVDENNIFIGATKGVFHLNYQKYNQNINKLTVLLGQVKASGKTDSVIFGGYFLSNNRPAFTQDQRSVQKLGNNYNSVHFEYSSTLFEQQNNIEFSYQLTGFDNSWSAWSEKSEKDYTNLPAGKYTFMVKARNNLGNESKPVSYSFQVLPAWYQTNLSYFIYFLLLAGSIHLIVKWQQRRHLKAQEKLKYLHQLELERNENEIVKLKNEKLEADVNYKNKELASTTMHLVQRGKVLAKIKEVVSNLEKMPNAANNSADFKQIFRLLNEVERSDADWDQFSIHFDHVHSNFLSLLKNRFPGLTPNELKLCAYLKMNLSSKEIAQLMSITIRAVEVSRYRLRKKLHIPSDVNLFDFLMQSLNEGSNQTRPKTAEMTES